VSFDQLFNDSQAGLLGFEFNSWFAVMAPAGRNALRHRREIERGDCQGLTPRGSSADQLGSATKAQLAKYAALIKKADIKAEQGCLISRVAHGCITLAAAYWRGL